MLAERAVIAGVGLIGGSLGLRWRQTGAVGTVVGYGRNPDRLRQALELGAIQEAATDWEGAVRGADLVVLAAPVRVCVRMAEQVARSVPPGCVVTDVGSTKREIAFAMAEAGVPLFIGGHPMAGSERSGVAAADPDLFEQAVWVLCPEEGTPPAALRRLRQLVEMTGAHPVVMSSAAHDHRVAAISHVPQLVAVALAEATARAAEGDPEVLALAGGGFRDTTRIAQSPAEMWQDVLESNRDEVLRGVERMETVLGELKAAVATGDREAVAAHFAVASEARRRVPARQKGLLPAYHDLVLYVPDRPGVIGGLCQALGDRGINVQDIEILRLREGEGGTLRLGFATADLAERAEAVLEGLAYRVRRR